VTTLNRARIVLSQVAVIFAAAGLLAAEKAIDMGDPAQVIHAYLRATYARDFASAYRHISAKDRGVRDLNRYVQQRGAFSGFALEVGKRVSESIQISVLKLEQSSNRAQVEIRYHVPDPKKIAPLVHNWDPFRLNGLPEVERSAILNTLENWKNEGAIEMREGKETFELAKEGDEWRVFLDWAAGVSVPFRLDLSKAQDLDARLSQNKFIVQPGDLFEISLIIKNPTSEPVTVRIGHVVEPQNIAEYLDLVQCGFLLPVTIAPGKEQQYSGTYMLRASIPEGVRQLKLNYDFRILK
jgi:Cytochrome c oxidase assembly protein CtaG/Cox11